MTIPQLAELAIKIRDCYVAKGWSQSDCQIGHYDGVLRLASDTGCYDFSIAHRVVDKCMGYPSKLAEFVASDLRKLSQQP